MIKIKGFENYAVSEDGIVHSLNYHRQGIIRPMKGTRDKDGYLQVGLRHDGKRKWFRVHRLVADAFLPNPESKEQVNHIDGNKANNHLSNLEWMTSSENIIHSFERLGKNQAGSNNNYAKMTEDQVIQIWKLKGTMKQTLIAKQLNVTVDMVSLVHRQKTWKKFTSQL